MFDESEKRLSLNPYTCQASSALADVVSHFPESVIIELVGA